MQISDAGLDLIKSFEGYLKRQANGDCTAYLCPAGVPTIGWGCTHGVRLGMRWTEQEATDGLRRELNDIEAAVNRYVTVPVNQNQYDALVSFTYNLGAGNLKKSTLLRKVNAGDFDGAEREFGKWVSARNGAGGKRIVYRGLVRRRKAEAAMFADNNIVPVPMAEQTEEQTMPQAPEKKPIKKSPLVPVGLGVGGFFAWLFDQIDHVFQWLILAASKFAELSPAKGMLAEAGANSHAIIGGLVAVCGFVALKLMWKPDEEAP